MTGSMLQPPPSRLFTFCYRLVIVPLLVLCTLVLLPFHRKLRQTMGLRLRPLIWPEWMGRAHTLWFHCASGEFEYAKPVILEWRRRHPDWKIYVTYFSPTFRRVIENFPGVDASAPLPLDLPGPMDSFVSRLKPQLLAVARTDLWPEMTHSCRRQGIPIVLFSSTRRPLRWWESWAKTILRWRYEGADHIYTVSATDKTELDKLHIRRPITVAGDTRYDQVLARLRSPKPLTLKIHSSRAPILVGGSTWLGDEEILIPAVADLIRQQRLKFIVVPHEPSPKHLKKLTALLMEVGLQSALYSSVTDWDPATVLIVDKVGILAEIYTLGHFAFVGGSFTGSVHSVMEPLAAGLVTVVGPDHHNNREAVEFSQKNLSTDLPMVSVAHNQNELTAYFEKLLNHPEQAQWASRIQSEVTKRSGATARLISSLETLTSGSPDLRADRPSTL